MKNIKIFSVIILLLVFVVSLVGCTIKNVAYKVESIDAELNAEFSSNGMRFQMVNKIASVEELKEFFENEYFGVGTLDKLTFFDESYFQTNCLLLVCYTKGDKEKYEITNISIRGEELFVTIERNYVSSAIFKYDYKFLTVKKEDIVNINKFSYIIKNTSKN